MTSVAGLCGIRGDSVGTVHFMRNVRVDLSLMGVSCAWVEGMSVLCACVCVVLPACVFCACVPKHLWTRHSIARPCSTSRMRKYSYERQDGLVVGVWQWDGVLASTMGMFEGTLDFGDKSQS